MSSKRLVAGAVLILVVLLTACGKSKVATSSGTTVSQAQLVSLIKDTRAKFAALKTAHFTQTIVLTPVTGTVQTISITGSVDLADHRVGMAFTLPGVGSIDAVLDGSTIYEKLPQLSKVLGGKPWIKIDPATLSRATGGPFGALLSSLQGALNQVQSQDPTSSLTLLSGVAGSVTTVGSEPVRGVATTHYRFAIDTAKAVAQLPADIQAPLKSFTSQLEMTGSLPAEAWIDGDGLTRKLHLTIDRSPTAGTPTPVISGLPKVPLPKNTELTMELFDFGAVVSVTAPPADQVTDLTAMLGQIGAGG